VTRIVLVCEGATDLPLACDLADRILRDTVDWLRDHDDLDELRSYRGLDENQPYLPWTEVKQRFEKSRLRLGRRFSNDAPSPDQVTTRKLLLLIAAHHQASRGGDGVNGVLIFRDADHQPERRRGIEAAREEFVRNHEAPESLHPWRQHIAIAVAEPMNEAWVMAGFEPAEDGEQADFAAAREELGFAPNASPEALDAREHGAKRSAKRVLAKLCPDSDRRARCWRETPLDTLRQRGERCGLTQFLDEVREKLATLFQRAS
jgi:hypothetical protein